MMLNMVPQDVKLVFKEGPNLSKANNVTGYIISRIRSIERDSGRPMGRFNANEYDQPPRGRGAGDQAPARDHHHRDRVHRGGGLPRGRDDRGGRPGGGGGGPRGAAAAPAPRSRSGDRRRGRRR